MKTIHNQCIPDETHNSGRINIPTKVFRKWLIAILTIAWWTSSFCTSAYPMGSILPKTYHKADAPRPATSGMSNTINQENEREILSFLHQDDVTVQCGKASV